jgi:FeS assembly SUF system regulator
MTHGSLPATNLSRVGFMHSPLDDDAVPGSYTEGQKWYPSGTFSGNLPSMLRISKLTDYAVALTTHLARCQVGPCAPGSADVPADLQPLAGAAAHPGGEAGHEATGEAGHENVRALAAATGVPEPTVRKVLKTLAHAGIVGSVRGTQGGYALARAAADISVADVVIAVEGPIAVTECASEATAGACDLEGRCNVQGPWQRISAAIRDALDKLTLADMAAPAAVDSASSHGSHDHSIVPLRVAGRDARGEIPAAPSNLGTNP